MKKPDHIKNNKEYSEIWDNLSESRNITDKDIPILTLLVYWHAVVESCMQTLEVGDAIKVSYESESGLKQIPDAVVLKNASAEIRALTAQLDQESSNVDISKSKGAVLNLVTQNRKARESRSNG